jgi:uncharacterized RDD family membrane protein YckC
VSDIEDGTSLPRAPFWRHLLAMVYDLFLIIPLLMVTSAALVAIHGPTETAAVRTVPAWQQWSLAYVALIGFYGTFWRQKGQTLGMQAWRVKLVSTETPIRVTWGQAAGRIIVASMPFILGLMPYLVFDVNDAGLWIYITTTAIASCGFLWRFFSEDRLYLHDLATGTELRLTPPREKS